METFIFLNHYNARKCCCECWFFLILKHFIQCIPYFVHWQWWEQRLHFPGQSVLYDWTHNSLSLPQVPSPSRSWLWLRSCKENWSPDSPPGTSPVEETKLRNDFPFFSVVNVTVKQSNGARLLCLTKTWKHNFEDLPHLWESWRDLSRRHCKQDNTLYRWIRSRCAKQPLERMSSIRQCENHSNMNTISREDVNLLHSLKKKITASITLADVFVEFPTSNS